MSVLTDILNNITASQREQINALRQETVVVGLSGGKDSLASCILLYALDIPYQTVTAEVWWKNNISGEHPLHYSFLHDQALPKLRSWGIDTNLVRSKITAYEYMTTTVAYSKNHPERIGKLRGFPLCGKCGIQRDCKIKPCNKFYKEKNIKNRIVGIAGDEKDRIITATANEHKSILDILKIPERITFPLCAEQSLLSPTYSFSFRGGCWFCPNQKIQELAILYMHYRYLWDDLMEIQNMPNKVQEKFNRKQTLYEIEKEILAGVQCRIFPKDLYG